MKRRLNLGLFEGLMGSEKLCPRNIPEQALKADGIDPVKNQSQEKTRGKSTEQRLIAKETGMTGISKQG